MIIHKWFCNWKKGKERLKEHEQSQTHNEAVMKWESLQRPSVTVLANSALRKDQEIRRQMLIKQLYSLRFLMHQWGIKGHGQKGNLFQLMKLQAFDYHLFILG